jgi:cell division initiation protein
VKFTPLDVRKQVFKKIFRGYDPEEVDAFLSMIGDELESLIHERNRANDEVIKLRTQLRDYQDVDQTLRNTLMKATSTVEESRMNSQREAQVRITEAELQAEKITENARKELYELRHEIELLRSQKESFSRRLRHLLESEIELIDLMGVDDVASLGTLELTGSAFNQRGRLPRPVIPDPALGAAEPSPEPMKQTDAEPQIIRGDKRFGESMAARQLNENDETAEEMGHEVNLLKPSGRISDQLAV